MKTSKKTDDAKTATAQTPALPMMTVGVEMIGPKQAETMLALNTRNRSVSTHHVEELAAAMIAGTYANSPQSICVLADGTLGDGQHRLLAVIRSGITVPMVVARGVPVAARDVIDTGFAVRSARHALQIADGIRLTKTTSAALTAMFILKRSGRLSGTIPHMTCVNLRDAMAEHGDDVEAVIRTACDGHRMRHAAFIAALAIARRTDPASVDAFCVCVRDRAGLTKNHPALAIRDFVDSKKSGGSAIREEISLKTFAAFEAFREGRPLSMLKCSESAREKYLAPWRKGDGTAK